MYIVQLTGVQGAADHKLRDGAECDTVDDLIHSFIHSYLFIDEKCQNALSHNM